MSEPPVQTADTPVHEPVWHDSRWRSSVRRKLVQWFADSARELPWRSEPTPYRVWISEIMLQQTQVATVLPYYDRFMRSFPDVASLAATDEASLMSHWEGLGYYRRARSMHAAAKQIAQQHDGVFPTDFDDVLALPGIGRYTAGAILSISGGQNLPILEGNTVRVFARWVALRSPVTETPSNKLLWRIAEAMLPGPRSKVSAGTLNQAAMELGALICTPKSPACDRCPVATHCQAHRTGLETEIPGKVTRIQYESRREFALVIRQDSSDPASPRYLVRPIAKGARWSGLWDFPRTTERSLASVDEATEELGQAIGQKLVAGSRLTTIKHAVTKFRISLDVHEATLAENSEPPRPWKFVSAAQMAELPMSVTARRIVGLLDKK